MVVIILQCLSVLNQTNFIWIPKDKTLSLISSSQESPREFSMSCLWLLDMGSWLTSLAYNFPFPHFTWGSYFLLWVKDVLLGRRHSYRCGLLSWFTILQCLVAFDHGPISCSFLSLSHCLLNQSYCHIAPENKIVTKCVLNNGLII